MLRHHWIKAAPFLLSFGSLAMFAWRAWHGNLTANPIEYITHFTGDRTIRFIVLTLALTPLRRLRGLPNLIRFRRMLGLFAFFYGSLYFLTWFWLDKYFHLHEIAQDVVKRRFITVGFLGLLMMLPLALTSTKGWVQRLGVKRWQWLHRLVYATAIPEFVHYYSLVKSDIRLPALHGLIMMILRASRMPGLRASSTIQTISLKFSGIRREAEDAVTLTFPLSHSLGAKPGQFLTFDWVVDGKKLPRSYSLSSSPIQKEFVEVTVKQQGIVSFLNREAKVGLTVKAHGPFGHFCFDEARQESVVLFAGGSGITPMMSMLRYIEDVAANTEITLFYAVRTENDVIFQKDLEGLRKRLPRFRLHMIVSKPGSEWRGLRGHVTSSITEEQLADIAHQTFFLCVPPAFMSRVNEILMSSGVATEQIRQERFTIGVLPSTNSVVAKCSMEFVRTGAKHEGSSSESLLMLAERHGIDIPYECRVGQCGTCVTRVLDADVEMEVEFGLEPQLRAQGYRLMCVGRASGDVRLDA